MPPPPGKNPSQPTPPPEVNAPATTRKPPDDRKFPCRQCGARLDFDPSQRALKCPYCGHEEKIEPSSHEVKERDWEEYWQNHEHEKETTLAGRASQVKCTGCGAVVLLEDKVVTDKCPYCATHLENQPESAQAMISPEGILPFAVTERQAVENFNRWIASRWFAPTELKQLANLGRLSGLYVPYWTYDSMTYSWYVGERGDNYTVVEHYTEQDSEGNTVSKTRERIEIRWTPVSGEVQHFFDDVLICASKGLPEPLVVRLTNWDLPKVEGFRAEFLSGFQTERYAVGLKEGFTKAQAIMDHEIRRMCLRDIGGDHQRLASVNTQHVGVTFKHLLLPIWLAPYRYRDNTYRILVNARTGEVVGTRPYSAIKITLLVLVILAAIGVAIYLITKFQGGEQPHKQRSQEERRRSTVVQVDEPHSAPGRPAAGRLLRSLLTRGLPHVFPDPVGDVPTFPVSSRSELRRYASNSLTTRPCTSVNRKSRPAYRYVSFS